MVVDVDFTTCPQYIQGYVPGFKFDKGAKFTRFSDRRIVVPEKDWKPLGREIRKKGGGSSRMLRRISNQRQEGSCVSHGSTYSSMICYARQLGIKRAIDLSPMSLYKQIGRSPGSGAYVPDAIDTLSTLGQLPLDTAENKARFKHTFPETGFYTPYPEGWKETAIQFRVLEWLVIDDLAEFVSALLQGLGVVYGRDGHCICCCEWDVDDEGNEFGKYVNSWDKWGIPGGDFAYGFGLDSRRKIASIDYAFAISQVEVSWALAA